MVIPIFVWSLQIKSLAAELGLERAFVLELLRDPPPNILLLSASLPDETTQTFDSSSRSPYDIRRTLEPESEPMESPLTTSVDVKSKPEKELPVHVMQKRWLMQKRLKKVHIETLEKVYSRTKRPTVSVSFTKGHSKPATLNDLVFCVDSSDGLECEITYLLR